MAATKPPAEAALHRARTALRRAACDLGVWRKGTAHTGNRPYTQAGADALRRIDEATRALHEARVALVAELRRDEDERAARTDALLADTQKSETAPVAPGAADDAEERTTTS